MNGLIQRLSHLTPLSDALKSHLEKEVIAMSLPKFHLLLEAPRTPSFIYYLESGFAISYVFEDGRKHVENFWKEGDIIFLSRDFCQQRPSMQFLQLVEASEVLHIPLDSVRHALELFPETNKIYTSILLDYYEKSQERLRDLRLLHAAGRHAKTLKQFPNLEQLVSQEFIASYIGVTPQSLSRIKKQKLV